jgi:uncharacterized protein (TIGR03083 family)
MPLEPLRPVDTRSLFRPVSSDLVSVLRSLQPGDWDRTTIAGRWLVRDIVAHLVDLTFRRLSFHRDRMVPPPPPRQIASERDFVDFINWLNGGWVDAAKRFSPRVLTDLFELASRDLADWFESLPLDAPALFGVSWAGEMESDGWFDVGREFVELWHHQQQIRLAVGAPPLNDPRYLQATLNIAMRGLPHAYRDVSAPEGTAIVLDVPGDAGGRWTLAREAAGWVLHAGEPSRADARIHLGEDAAWKLLFNALRAEEGGAGIRAEGPAVLTDPVLRARAVIV